MLDSEEIKTLRQLKNIDRMLHDKPLGNPKLIKKQKKSKRSVNKESSKRVRKLFAHALLRDIVILRDKECVCPPPEKGHSSILQAGHLIPGTKGGTYFDLYNVHCQCHSCNGRHTRFEKYYVGWFIREFGEEEYLRLEKDSDNIGLKTYEVEEIIVQLQEIKNKQLLAIDLGEYFKPYFTQKEILSGAWKNMPYGFSLEKKDD